MIHCHQAASPSRSLKHVPLLPEDPVEAELPAGPDAAARLGAAHHAGAPGKGAVELPPLEALHASIAVDEAQHIGLGRQLLCR